MNLTKVIYIQVSDKIEIADEKSAYNEAFLLCYLGTISYYTFLSTLMSFFSPLTYFEVIFFSNLLFELHIFRSYF